MPNQESAHHQPINANLRHKAELSTQDKIALIITRGIGTMYAVYFFALFMLFWMFWQTALSHQAFDPFPFAFLLFLGNIIQLLLMPLIMVGQNIQGRHAEIRADEEYKTTQASHRAIERIIGTLDTHTKQLERQNELLEKLTK